MHACTLNPEIQLAPSPIGTLRNIIVRIPGNHSGNVILIVSHLDSVSYGAGDNASGVAVLMEVACSLQAGEPLKNDIVLLFEDGEEVSSLGNYLGGYAFAATDASINTIRYAIGLDTAGWGPVVIIETTPNNADLIQIYANSVQNPTAFGFFADMVSITGDTSEIQPFRERGILGLALEDPTAFYGKHHEADTVEMIHPGSLQQMGDQVLSLVQALGDSDLTSSSGSKHSYFTLYGLGVVDYPAELNLAFAALSVIGLAALIAKGIREEIYSVRVFFLSTVYLLLVIIGAVIVGVFGSIAFRILFPPPYLGTEKYLEKYLIPASLPFFLVVLLIILLAYLIVRKKLVKTMGSPAATLAGLLIWISLSIVSSILLPVGSYIFTIPSLAMVLVAFLPDRWKFIQVIPAGIATVLSSPNVVLTFLSSGMLALAPVTILMILNTELWADASSSFTSDQLKR